MANTTHFDSIGKQYSYGNKGKFGVMSNTSVGQQVNKNKYVNAQINALVIEKMDSTEIEISINDLSQTITLVRSLIAPVLNIVFEHQNTHGNINLCEVTAFKTGLWQISAAFNAQTKKFYTKNDST